MIFQPEHIENHYCSGSDGKKYVVLVFQELIDVSSNTDPDGVMPGLRRLRLSTGEAVRFVEEGKYFIVSTGVTLDVDERHPASRQAG